VISFGNEKELLDYAKNDRKLTNFLAGVVFEGNLSPSSFPVNVTMKLRFQPDPLNVLPGEQSPFAA